MQVLPSILFYIIELRTSIMLMMNYITCQLFPMRSIKVMDNGHIRSVYIRYLMIYALSYFQWCLTDMLYTILFTMFDVEARYIHVEKIINGVVRCIVCENTYDNFGAIEHTIRYIEHYEKRATTKPIPFILMKCAIKNNVTGAEQDIKNIVRKYLVDTNEKTMLELVLVFNNISYTPEDRLCVTITANRNKIIKDVHLLQILNTPIYELLYVMSTG